MKRTKAIRRHAKASALVNRVELMLVSVTENVERGVALNCDGDENLITAVYCAVESANLLESLDSVLQKLRGKGGVPALSAAISKQAERALRCSDTLNVLFVVAEDASFRKQERDTHAIDSGWIARRTLTLADRALRKLAKAVSVLGELVEALPVEAEAAAA